MPSKIPDQRPADLASPSGGSHHAAVGEPRAPCRGGQVCRGCTQAKGVASGRRLQALSVLRTSSVEGGGIVTDADREMSGGTSACLGQKSLDRAGKFHHCHRGWWVCSSLRVIIVAHGVWLSTNLCSDDTSPTSRVVMRPCRSSISTAQQLGVVELGSRLARSSNAVEEVSTLVQADPRSDGFRSASSTGWREFDRGDKSIIPPLLLVEAKLGVILRRHSLRRGLSRRSHHGRPACRRACFAMAEGSRASGPHRRYVLVIVGVFWVGALVVACGGSAERCFELSEM